MREFARKNKIIILVVLIMMVGAYFRLSEFGSLLRFNSDQVRDAQIVDAMFEKNDFPLLGPKAGGTTFKLGPAFYYLEYLSGSIFGNTPAGIAAFIPILSIFSIPLFFLLLRFYFAAHISLVLTFLYAISYYATRYSRFAWNPNAIFFFLILFLLSLLKIITGAYGKKFTRWHFLLALSIGIGIQLHTTLLILMPTLLIAIYVYVSLKEKKILIANFLAISAIIISLNFPFLAYDWMNGGSNLKSFFAGTEKKTEKSGSIYKNILNDGQFFIQGNLYALSGFEPQKNWTNPKKLLASKDMKEIFSAAAGTTFFIFGLASMFYLFRKEKEEKKKKFLGLMITFLGASFLLFIPLANVLNLRFFVILIFLPFIFLGMLMMTAERLAGKRYSYLMILPLLSALAFSNLFYYHRTYDLENYSAPSSAYGGISLGELEGFSQFISEASGKEKTESGKIYLLPFEFERSIEYINDKSGILADDFSAKDTADGSVVFLMAEKKDADEALEKQKNFFSPIDSRTIGRYEIFSLLYEAPQKIGFITDIHAKRGGEKKKFALNAETRETMEYFVNHMNSDFQPDFVVQNGDLIDGTKRWGQESVDDFKLITSYFEDLKMPFYNVIGNHEMRGFSKDTWIDLIGQKKSYYYFDYAGLRVIVLDGDENREIGKGEIDQDAAHYLSESQIRWTEEVVSKNNNLKKVIFIHYPIVNGDIAPGEKIIARDQASRLKEMFSKNNVIAVFSGHVEKLEMETVDGVDYFIIPGLERSDNKEVLWLDTFADITIGKKAEIKLHYKKDRAQDYETLMIPSEEFTNLSKASENL